MPAPPSSSAALRTSISMPAFDTQYAVIQRCVRMPAIDEMATIEPPPPASSIARPACLIVSMAPVRFVARTLSQAARCVSSSGPNVPVPAAATQPYRPPVASAAVFTAALTWSSFATSPVAMRTSAPVAVRSFSRAASSFACVRPMSVTIAPSAPLFLAHPHPLPEPPPVTRMCLPASASLISDGSLHAALEALGQDLRRAADHVGEDVLRGARLVQHAGDLAGGVHQQLEAVSLAGARHDLAGDDALHAHRQRVELLALPVLDERVVDIAHGLAAVEAGG